MPGELGKGKLVHRNIGLYTAIMTTALDKLREGDRLRALEAEGRDLACIAQESGRSPQHCAKTMWLAATYDDASRRDIGEQVLSRLRPSHLEIVASVGGELRMTLLKEAAAGGFSVARLKERREEARARTGRCVTVTGGEEAIASAERALRMYSRWSPHDLGRLMAGKNGSAIRDLAAAGSALDRRLREEGLQEFDWQGSTT